MYIEKERISERLNVIWEVDEDLQLTIPAGTIQLLLENAIEQGIMKQIAGGEIRIRVDCL